MNESEIYYADFLKKEDLTGKWRFYWASLDCKGIYFYLGKTLEQNGNFQQFIELTPGSRCELAKRRMYSFRFKLLTEEASYTLKCDSILQRHRWMYMINLVVRGRPREPPPNSLNCVVITDATDNNTSNDDEKDSFNQHDNELKSSSFTRTFSFRKIKSWKKRNNSLPPARCLRKNENTIKENCQKTSYTDCSFNFAENLAYFDD